MNRQERRLWNRVSAVNQKEGFSREPEFTVPIDMVVVENNQKSVDEGHSPWRLDPVFVAQVYVSLLLSPEGIQGEYPIPYEDLKIIQIDTKEAIAQIENELSPVRLVYLKRLIRQDDTGIWTVVGVSK